MSSLVSRFLCDPEINVGPCPNRNLKIRSCRKNTGKRLRVVYCPPPHRRTIEGASGIKRYCNPSVCLSHATMTKTVRFRHMVIYWKTLVENLMLKVEPIDQRDFTTNGIGWNGLTDLEKSVNSWTTKTDRAVVTIKHE